MNGTVKQFKDTLEQMKTIYAFDDDKTYLTTHNVINAHINDHLQISTTDEKTGITIVMDKYVTKEADVKL